MTAFLLAYFTLGAACVVWGWRGLAGMGARDTARGVAFYFLFWWVVLTFWGMVAMNRFTEWVLRKFFGA